MLLNGGPTVMLVLLVEPEETPATNDGNAARGMTQLEVRKGYGGGGGSRSLAVVKAARYREES